MTKETFFIQIPPGLEELAKKEFHLKFVNINTYSPEPTIEKGGLSVQLPLEEGLKLNYWLKIPNRILLRLAHFKCRDLPKLFNKVSKLPMSSYYAGQEFQFHISSSQSRLFDSRKIEKTLKESLEHNLLRQEPKKKAKERVLPWEQWHFFCRFQDDWCELSLDTSGERLGKRGEKTKVGRAPLRENLSAALYFQTLQSIPSHWSDLIYQGEKEILLVDPFAGSGTLLTESSTFFKPSIKREYSFQFFPLFLGKEQLISPPRDPQLKNHTILVAGEFNEQQYVALEENINQITNQTAHLILGDSFNGNLKKVLEELQGEEAMAICVTNPPYGKRIEKETTKIESLLEQIFNLYDFEYVGLLLPKEFILPLDTYSLIKKLPFSHGGTDVIYSIWKKIT
jgi:putative N6-adenine-specific DNA methylase